MLFYFTGTGNSLYVAKNIYDKPISIPQIINREKLSFRDESIGIVSPVYGHEVPPMVKEFLKKSTFDTEYFYMILTYGNRHGGAAKLADNLCKECGIIASYINIIIMVDNWLPSFDMNEQILLDKKVDEHIAEIVEDIKNKKKMISLVTDTDRQAHKQFLGNMSKMPADAWQHLLKVGEKCIGYGICEKVCPSSSIKIENGKAFHIPGNCQTCLACAHACPQKAIGLAIPEKNPDARYRNEHIELSEIIEANNQKK
ncbi:EFR1 family ferrodoxin [Clostridium neonatale]|uniref:EFR1 family ferrodoxin n=1 Tax=Clostridium neonatale TaxID=137838 RepID=UPI00291BB4EC|nr:Ferredoxin-2 [Clostridium neonatale]CAI3554415.1 Ferredoxin-2 [Clostridium neonatale]CAI3562195.1 Ferredoxin-2 [Clostridium neonatale]CAI3623498.1 Ferredoxin-2 [Clostridium neonatale]CAI3677980.1 Ferredoxin-2 [Clostridium neonatale]